MGIDAVYARRALADLSHWAAYLRDLGPLSAGDLAADLTRQLAVLHALQLAIQTCLDLGAHLLAGIGAAPAGEYSSVGPELAVRGLIPTDLGGRLGQMARFRNILVHHYRDINLEIVVANLVAGLPDFDEFAGSIIAFLERPA